MCEICSAETGKVKLDALWFLSFVVTLNLRELGCPCACGFWSLTALKLGAELAASTSGEFLASCLRSENVAPEGLSVHPGAWVLCLMGERLVPGPLLPSAAELRVWMTESLWL